MGKGRALRTVGMYREWEELSPETTVGLAPCCDSSAWRCLETGCCWSPVGSGEAWGGVQLIPSQSKYEEYACSHWSLGSPSGTEPDLLGGHFLLHCQAFILGSWQGNQSLLCAKY